MRGVKCRNCVNLKHDWCKKVIDSPHPDLVRDCAHFREKTNADAIRAMSDEELAKALGTKQIPSCARPGEFCKGRTCTGCFLEWLKQPASFGND